MRSFKEINNLDDNEDFKSKLLNAYDGFLSLDSGEHNYQHISITGYGDSVASVSNYVIGDFISTLQLTYGIGALMTPNLGNTWFNAQWTHSGGASHTSIDFTYLPGANQIVIPDGGSSTITTSKELRLGSATHSEGEYSAKVMNQKGPTLVKVKHLYLTTPGAGVVTINMQQDDAIYSDKIIDTNGTLDLVSFEEPLLNDNDITLTVSSSGGEIIYIGSVFYARTGVMGYGSQVGGSDMSSQNAFITNGNYANIYYKLLDEMNTKLVIHSQRINDYTDTKYEDEYKDVFDMFEEYSGNISQIVLGEGPRTDDVTYIPIVNKYLNKLSSIYNFSFLDQYKLFGSNNDMLVKWAISDNVHWDAKAWRFVSGKLIELVNNFSVGTSTQKLKSLTLSDYAQDSVLINSLLDLKSTTNIITKGWLSDSDISSVYTASTSNAQGIRIDSGAAEGYYAALLGNVVGESAIYTQDNNITLSFFGFRGIYIKGNARAFLAFGVNGPFQNIDSISDKSFGVEFGRGDDIGVDMGVARTVVRIFHTDGITPVYSKWYDLGSDGSGIDNTKSVSFTLYWNSINERLSLFENPDGTGAMEILSLNASYFAINQTYRSQAMLGLFSTGPQTESSHIAINRVESRWQSNASSALQIPFANHIIYSKDKMTAASRF